MRSATRALCTLAFALPLPLAAEQVGLVVQVEDTQGRPVSGVVLALREGGTVGPPTDSVGKTRIPSASATTPGSWVKLEVVPLVPETKTRVDWVLVSPWHQRVRMPSSDDPPGPSVQVVLGRRGSRDLLKSDQAMAAVASRILARLDPRPDKAGLTDDERKRALAEQAAALGLNPKEVETAIRAWGAKAGDPYHAGLAALYDRNYAAAEARLAKLLEILGQEPTEPAEVAEASFFLGQALFKQRKFRKAAAAYREAKEADGDDDVKLAALGLALFEAGDYGEAVPPLERALALRERSLGAEHLQVAASLIDLADLYDGLDRYAEAEPLYQRALAIREKILGAKHPDVATTLNGLGALYWHLGRHAEAEPLLQCALAILEKAVGAEHSEVATTLNNLALVYHDQGRWPEAEPLYRRSLKMGERTLGENHPEVGAFVNNLAVFLKHQERYSEAEALYQRSLTILEQALGPEHPNVAISQDNLATLYAEQGKYPQAEVFYGLLVSSLERSLGAEHPKVALALNALALAMHRQGRYSEAEPLYRRAVQIQERALAPEHADLADTMSNLAELYFDQKKLEAAEDLSRQALTMSEKALGRCHDSLFWKLTKRFDILLALGRIEESDQMLARMTEVRTGDCKP